MKKIALFSILIFATIFQSCLSLDSNMSESLAVSTIVPEPLPIVTPSPTPVPVYVEVDIPDFEILNFSEKTEVYHPSSIYVMEYKGDIYYIDSDIIYRMDTNTEEISVYYDGTDFIERLHDYYWTVDTRHLTSGGLRAFYIYEDTLYGFVAMADVTGIEFYALYNLETEKQIKSFEGVPYGAYQEALLYDTSYLLVSPYRDNPELDKKMNTEQAMFGFQDKTAEVIIDDTGFLANKDVYKTKVLNFTDDYVICEAYFDKEEADENGYFEYYWYILNRESLTLAGEIYFEESALRYLELMYIDDNKLVCYDDATSEIKTLSLINGEVGTLFIPDKQSRLIDYDYEENAVYLLENTNFTHEFYSRHNYVNECAENYETAYQQVVRIDLDDGSKTVLGTIYLTEYEQANEYTACINDSAYYLVGDYLFFYQTMQGICSLDNPNYLMYIKIAKE